MRFCNGSTQWWRRAGQRGIKRRCGHRLGIEQVERDGRGCRGTSGRDLRRRRLHNTIGNVVLRPHRPVGRTWWWQRHRAYSFGEATARRRRSAERCAKRRSDPPPSFRRIGGKQRWRRRRRHGIARGAGQPTMGLGRSRRLQRDRRPRLEAGISGETDGDDPRGNRGGDSGYDRCDGQRSKPDGGTAPNSPPMTGGSTVTTIECSDARKRRGRTRHDARRAKRWLRLKPRPATVAAARRAALAADTMRISA